MKEGLGARSEEGRGVAQAWVETQRRALRKPPKPLQSVPKNVVRRTMALVMDGAYFQWFTFLALGGLPTPACLLFPPHPCFYS